MMICIVKHITGSAAYVTIHSSPLTSFCIKCQVRHENVSISHAVDHMVHTEANARANYRSNVFQY